jgi:hypothetical protein
LGGQFPKNVLTDLSAIEDYRAHAPVRITEQSGTRLRVERRH